MSKSEFVKKVKIVIKRVLWESRQEKCEKKLEVGEKVRGVKKNLRILRSIRSLEIFRCMKKN